jgi:hypothetical protein
MTQNVYILSLTTIPSKINNLYITMDSLICQTRMPDKIILNIPRKYSFRMNNTEIPIDKLTHFMEKYQQYNCVINMIDTDYGPGTKLLGLFENDIIDMTDKNTYIILVDDDIIYKPYMIETFDTEIRANNIDVASFYGYNVSHIRIAQGVDGFLMKSTKLLYFLDYYEIIKHCDYVNYHDDFYISFYFHILDQEINIPTLPNSCLMYEGHKDTFTDALCEIKGKYSRQNLNNEIYKILVELDENNAFSNLKSRGF